MAKTPKRRDVSGFRYCSIPHVPEPVFPPDVTGNRLRLIRTLADKWVNGTVLHYYFFDKDTDGETVLLSDNTTKWIPWTTTPSEKAVVRRAFDVWKSVGIGLEFKEVSSRHEAEIRIGFMPGDGAWSYLGRNILEHGPNERTMNLGWSLTRPTEDIDTPIHEIGHSLGFPHEHQNPNAGIKWNEEAVYAALAKPPNKWTRSKTFYNIIRKIEPDTVQGSVWDPDSIMHYPFNAGLIDLPEQYRNGLTPAGGLSPRDKAWVTSFYPPLARESLPTLKTGESVKLAILSGEQRDFVIRPEATRYYDMRTFGTSDTVLALFENDEGELRYMTADDDSGDDRNASIHIKLYTGREYVLRVRLNFSDRAEEISVMMW